ncbi:MAG: 3-ketoacyl-ACP reductase [Rikenellaceae bacterium]|jgi:NAD(P)-dependent dehydrogenase (short-subunit alcohol dehydrogenase family)|nr:3-ketoacyl-ACP reductase [Rikenellaceae bacterium]
MARKTALITGGARGIGLGVARQLAAAGFDLTLTGTRPEEEVRKILDELRATGGEVLYMHGNVALEEDCRAWITKTVEKFGRLDVLVNNAGIAPRMRADLLETTEASLDEVFAVNVKGTFFMSQAAAWQMVSQGEGIIINISSVSASVSSPNRPEYCMSKAAVGMMTTLFADRLAADGVRVYEIRPGVIRTDMTVGVTEKYDRLLARGEFPIARWGLPEDIGKAVVAFATGAFPYSTGEVVRVDGGFHLRRL